MISRIRVTDFRCPSDPTEHIFYDRGPTSYAVSIGSQFMPGNFCDDYPGNTFGTGPSAFGFESRGNMVSGAFGGISYSSRNRDFRDGLSQVFLVGEMIGDKRIGVSGWADNWLTGSWAATSTPLNFPIKAKGRRGHLGRDCFSRVSFQTAFSFQSAHPDGANFLFADGHTQFVHERIDYLTYQRLGDRRDGGLVSLAK